MASKTKKPKEFQWNKLSRMDYAYFISARIYPHMKHFISAYQATDGGLNNNGLYLCFKENGDINAVITKIKLTSEDWVITYGKNGAHMFSEVHKEVAKDLETGNLGKFVYVIMDDDKFYYLHRIRLKDLEKKDKNNVIKLLKSYRHGAIDSPGNDRFYEDAKRLSTLDPEVIISPPNKKQKLFQNKLFELQ